MSADQTTPAEVEQIARLLARSENPCVNPNLLVWRGEPFRVRLPGGNGEQGYCPPVGRGDAKPLWTYYRPQAEMLLREMGGS